MDSIIDIIILILIGVVPAVFKAIGNKLEKSGKTEKAAKFKKISDVFEDEEGESTLEGWLLEKMDKEEKPVEPVALDPAPVVVMKPAVQEIDIMDYIDKPETVVKSQIKRLPPQTTVKKKPMMLIEEEPEKKGEKIDPKKLVLYSEIMKRKF